jgi:hypothetical protein
MSLGSAKGNVQDEERIALAKKLFSFNDEDSSFIDKMGALIEKYHIRPPAVTVAYQVHLMISSSTLDITLWHYS